MDISSTGCVVARPALQSHRQPHPLTRQPFFWIIFTQASRKPPIRAMTEDTAPAVARVDSELMYLIIEPYYNMPRGRSLQVTIESPPIVSQFLANNYFDMAKRCRLTDTCPVCMEDLYCCKRCFLMLRCGHAMHSACYFNMKGTDCPVCRAS